MSPVTLDYNNMLAPSLDGAGVPPEALQGPLADAFREAHADVEARRESGEMGFFQLPYASDTVTRVQQLADGFGQWFENVVILGIGGSALGSRTIREALLGPLWNQGGMEERDHFPRLYVLDNVDPGTVSEVLDRLDLRRTLFNVVSKSGSTAETMAQYLVVAQRLRSVVGEESARGHFLFTTGSDQGALRRIAEAEEIPTLPVPENVGGRFSVLSPVGLLPAAVVGIEIRELLEGAAEIDERCRTPDLRENPAGLLATLLHHADTELGAGIHVLMPYADRLRTLALWHQQLWAESLGKAEDREGRSVHVGPTPLPALGATDQHSQVQLFMEGPRDKVVMFLAVRSPEAAVPIPDLHPGIPQMGYLGGHTLAELLDAERRATTEALRRRGRLNMTLEIETLDARTLGALFMLFEIATVYAGALYGVNPLNQPGVELGKELTYGLLGRDGFEAPDLHAGDERWRID